MDTGALVIGQVEARVTLTEEAAQGVHTDLLAVVTLQSTLVQIMACLVVSVQYESIATGAEESTVHVVTALGTVMLVCLTLIDVCALGTLTVGEFGISRITLTDVGWLTVHAVRVLSALIIGGAVVTFVYVCRALGAGPAGLAHTPSQRVTVKCPHSTATLVLTANTPTVCLVTTLTRFLVCQQSGSWGTGAVESPRRVVTEVRTAMCVVSTLIYVCALVGGLIESISLETEAEGGA